MSVVAPSLGAGAFFALSYDEYVPTAAVDRMQYANDSCTCVSFWSVPAAMNKLPRFIPSPFGMYINVI